MSPQTAKFIIHRNGLSCFTIRELRDLLRDRFNPLPGDVRTAVDTLTRPERPKHWTTH